jgi:hypothetical protein
MVISMMDHGVLPSLPGFPEEPSSAKLLEMKQLFDTWMRVA